MFKINASQLPRAEQQIVDKNNWAIEQKQRLKSKEIIENGDYISHLSNCVVSVVPVKSDEAVYLYGSKQKLLTFNKVTISEALVHKENKNDIKKGRSLVEFYVTDENLSLAMINQGGNTCPITFSQLEGESLDLSDIEPVTNSVDLNEMNLEKGIQKQSDYIKEALDGLLSELDKAKPSKKVVNALFVTLSSAANNINENAIYDIHLLSENLTKDINSVNFELQSTIDRLVHYSNSTMVDLLEDMSKDYSTESYLKWFMMGGFQGLEKSLYISILSRLNEKNPNPKVTEYIQSYKNERNQPKRPIGEVYQGALSFNNVMGRTMLAHDENAQERVLELRLQKSYVQKDNRIRYNTTKELLRIAFSPNDLLMLLRGREDSFIMGTMTRYAGEGIELVKLQEYVTETIKLKSSMKGLNNQLQALVEKLHEMFNKPMKKAEKEQAKTLIAEIEKELEKSSSIIFDQALGNQDKLQKIFEDRLREKIKSSLKGLPNHHTEDVMKLLK